jgi:predicted CDP-diglyceride synthetase/phosphatidate cytidylyltransferase|tara:strand:+ start:417 stop:620 length:204 start_codon:yes stop_codon:yes gene_type:complete
MSSVAGYNVGEEVKEIGTELRSSRGELIIAILGFIGGTVIASSIKDVSIIDKIKSWFGYDQEEDEEE